MSNKKTKNITEEQVDHLVETLNGILLVDRKAVSELLKVRIPCNEDLLEHPTVQVRKYPGEQATVGVLGLLNGIIATDNADPIIAAQFEVKCPHGCDTENLGLVLNDTCPHCNSLIELGNIAEFVKYK